MEGPTGTPYENKFFLLKLVFSQDFPSTPPRGFFLTKIYHPNVDMTTGAICVNTLKKDWTSETTVAHVLAVIRCLLIVPFPESSLNDEAGKMFMESYQEYSKRARLMADVHGRPMSACDTSSSSDGGAGGSGDPAEKNTDARVLKSSSDNPQRNNNNNKKVSKQPSSSGKMSKKKSLKRL
jgi:ubiquitin-conjugating enzyme E2 S